MRLKIYLSTGQGRPSMTITASRVLRFWCSFDVLLFGGGCCRLKQVRLACETSGVGGGGGEGLQQISGSNKRVR